MLCQQELNCHETRLKSLERMSQYSCISWFLLDKSREEHSMDQYRWRLKLPENFERHWSILISGEIHMDQSLVHTFSWGNSYGPMVLKVLLKFPPTLVLVHGWLFPEELLQQWPWQFGMVTCFPSMWSWLELQTHRKRQKGPRKDARRLHVPLQWSHRTC